MHDHVSLERLLKGYIDPYQAVDYHYDSDVGFIVWRRGTGGNDELLHIRTFEPGKGYGRKLIYLMLDQLLLDPPYHSVFGFTRVGNVEAREFYGALGFNLQSIQGVYAEGEAVLFWQSYRRLLELKDEYENSLRG